MTAATGTWVLDLVDPDHLDAVLRTGITWLTASVQPDDAVTQHHGLVALAADGVRVRFAPAQPQGGPPDSAVVSIDAGWQPGNPSPGPRLLTVPDCAHFEAAIAAAGGNVDHSWNGPGCNSGSWAITGISPSLAAAVTRYYAGCPVHDSVFCGRSDRPDPCTWYRDGHARLIVPTFPRSNVDAPQPAAELAGRRRAPSDSAVQLVIAGIAGAGAYCSALLAIAITGSPTAILVAGTAGVTTAWVVYSRPAAKAARAVALALAIRSHGPAAGAKSDPCFPGRAAHFLRYIRTGANPKPPPVEARWCSMCAAPEWCLGPDGGLYPHTYTPAED